MTILDNSQKLLLQEKNNLINIEEEKNQIHKLMPMMTNIKYNKRYSYNNNKNNINTYNNLMSKKNIFREKEKEKKKNTLSLLNRGKGSKTQICRKKTTSKNKIKSKDKSQINTNIVSYNNKILDSKKSNNINIENDKFRSNNIYPKDKNSNKTENIDKKENKNNNNYLKKFFCCLLIRFPIY